MLHSTGPRSSSVGFSKYYEFLKVYECPAEHGAHLFLNIFCRTYLSQKNVIEKLEDGVTSGRHAIMVENTFHLLAYVSQLDLFAVCSSGYPDSLASLAK